ncbi:MAG TPA: YtxH domain-containing protein [Pyrinomonadaceae bacterium]|jgi:gas vesicle protein|nr:YtxH domain-containing protein [Pyrinomonadaceae bacterium]
MARNRENYRRNEMGTGDKVAFILIGGGIGAVLALLFAPKPGVELREDIADVTRKGLEKGRETAAQVGERAGEYYEVAREKAGEIYGVAAERTEGLVGQVREKATRPANTFSAAIEAGKKAYFEEKRRTEPASISEGRPSYPSELGTDNVLSLPERDEK